MHWDWLTGNVHNLSTMVVETFENVAQTHEKSSSTFS